MAHDIAQINGKDAIAYVGETPWHRLGTAVPAGITLTDALVAASLDWDVKALPTYADIAGQPVKLDMQAIIRETDGTVLGTVGPRFTPIQHREAFALFEPAITAGQVRIDVLGALGHGETVWMLLKLAEEAQAVRTLKDGRPDTILPYIKLVMGHAGQRSLIIGDTGVRVVCRNTLSQSDAEGRSDWVTVRHTSNNVEGQLKAVGKVIERAAERYRSTMEIYRQLAATPITEADMLAYVDKVLPLPEKPRNLVVAAEQGAAAIADRILVAAGIGPDGSVNDALVNEQIAKMEASWKTQVGLVEAERVTAATLATTGLGNDGSTVWDAYNGVTELVDHTARRDTDHAKERAAISAISGEGALVKARALTLAQDMVAA